MLTEKRDQEPERVFFVLLQVDQSSARNEIHPLCVPEWFRLRLLLEHGHCRQDPVQFVLAWLLFLKELQVGKRAPNILPDLRHGRPLRHTRLEVPRYKLFIEVLRIRVSDPVELAPIDPEVSPLDRGAQASILEQDLLHALAQLLVHPIVVRLVAFASRARHVPPIVFSRLHHSEETHVVQEADQGSEDAWQGQTEASGRLRRLPRLSPDLVLVGASCSQLLV